MKTPEQIADAIANNNETPGWSWLDEITLTREDLHNALIEAAREAQREPQFKPEGEPDEYRDADEWVAENARSEGYILRVEDIDRRDPDEWERNDSRSFDLSAAQARHILAYLSETSES